MTKQSLNFITFTNKGYVEYTHNLISSIEKNKLSEKIKIYALDNFSLDQSLSLVWHQVVLREAAAAHKF